jgi:hypothetical protein
MSEPFDFAGAILNLKEAMELKFYNTLFLKCPQLNCEVFPIYLKLFKTAIFDIYEHNSENARHYAVN